MAWSTPLIELDYTLASLYEQSSVFGERLVIVNSVSARAIENAKYVYHNNEAFQSTANSTQRTGGKSWGFLRSLRAQRYCICVGPMQVVMFSENEHLSLGITEIGWAEKSVQSTLKVLCQHQKPEVLFHRRPLDVSITDAHIILAMSSPLDALEGYKQVVDPSVLYELSSKRGLALSGLCTPRSELIECDWSQMIEDELSQPCDSTYPQPKPLSQSIFARNWSSSTIKEFYGRTLPFVLKLQQTITGQGTFVIKTESDRESLLARLPTLLTYNINCLNKSNLHLKPATLVVTDYISCSRDHDVSFAVTFFVNRNGTHKFICCVEQDLDAENQWQGASISFSEQENLEVYLSQTISDVANFLHCRSYHGPVGIDILVDDQSRQWVVDLNVRPPGSLILGLLRSHLSVQRKLHEARLISAIRSVHYKDEFCNIFANEFQEGRIILVGWVEERGTNVAETWAALVLAAKTKDALELLFGKVSAVLRGKA